MRISFNWLKELVDIPWTPAETAERLASLGFPVEKIETTGVQASNVVAVKILSIEKHPNADRLRVATVTDGREQRRIVCGAPNIAVDQVVPLALPGARLPGGIEITISKIRGVESGGMLCSERELGLSQEHAGILLLPEEATLGDSVQSLLGGSDTLLEVEVTPNRPDMLSHIGIARECAALARLPLNATVPSLHNAGVNNSFDLKRDDEKDCSFYWGRLFHAIQVKPSPKWMSDRLQRCGIRPINNIVDITNYVLLEWGHPLHAFDVETLKGPSIQVRRATRAESIHALDGKKYDLTPEDLVIADAQAPIALAGIMGGEHSGVTDKTTTILLESGVFDRRRVRQTSKRLALRSESSIRFEKGTAISTALLASERAAALIKEWALGKEGNAAMVGSPQQKKPTIVLRSQRLSHLLGSSSPQAIITEFLERLDLSPTKTEHGWACAVPDYRSDIKEEVDLVEEVARLIGYNQLTSTTPRFSVGRVPPAYRPWDKATLLSALRGAGFNETLTSSFCEGSALPWLGGTEPNAVRVANPLSKETSFLRPSLLPNLLKAVSHNLNRQQPGVFLFETGRVFSHVAGTVEEETHLTLVAAGQNAPASWRTPNTPMDFFTFKGVLERIAPLLTDEVGFFSSLIPPFLHPFQAVSVQRNKNVIGSAGALHPSVSKQLGLSVPVFVADLSLSKAGGVSRPFIYHPLPKFPAVERDIAVLLPKSVSWEDVRRVVERTAGALLESITPFDIFETGKWAADTKSVAFRLRLRDPHKTLVDTDIHPLIDKIKTALEKACGAQLR